MNDELLEQKIFLFKIKQNYPYCEIYIEKPNILDKFLMMMNLYLIKDRHRFIAILSSREYTQVVTRRGYFPEIREPQLLLHSCKFHDWNEVVDTLHPFFPKIHVTKKIIGEINQNRYRNNDESVDSDEDNYGEDFVLVINKRIVELTLKIKRDYSINLVSDLDIQAYGEYLIETIDMLVSFAMINDEIKFDNPQIKLLIESWGLELIEMIYDRARYCNYCVRMHFEDWKRDAYLLGDDSAIELLSC